MRREENDLLTQTSAGTPGGDLLRRYWQPVFLSAELKTDTPEPVEIMGEKLVLFRDESGHAALLGTLCPHRCADLSYGRVEDNGIRCLYHGWLFDRHGHCLDQPAEPVESTYKNEIRHTAYPCHEAAGAIFAYMGPGEPPPFPNFHFMSAPEDHVFQNKIFHACNYLQGNEGNMDPSHLSFLHANSLPRGGKAASEGELHKVVHRTIFEDQRPSLQVEKTRYGIRIFAERKKGEGKKLVRITNFVFPNFGFFSGEDQRYGEGGYSVHWHVPINDTSHWRFDFCYHSKEKLDKEHMLMRIKQELGENHVPRRSAANRYLQDREQMKGKSYAGLGAYFAAHDLFAVESAGPIHDRTREYLGQADVAIVASRRMLLDAMKNMKDGKPLPFTLEKPEDNRFNDILVISAEMGEDEDPRGFCRTVTESGDFHAIK